MRLTEFARAATFRWTLVVFSAFALAIFVSFAFVYLRASSNMAARIDAAIMREANALAAEAPTYRLLALEERLRQDPRNVKPAALFDADGKLLAGNIESLPRGLLGTDPMNVSIMRTGAFGRERKTVRATARRLSNGETLMIAWSDDYSEDIAEVLKSGLVFSLIPALCLGLATAIFLSIRAQKRVKAVNDRVQRIIAGELRQRLPTRGTDEPFDKLATIVNGMLDEIETLIQSLAGVGDDIAHDLRTPLTRVRMSLDRGRTSAQSLAELQAIVGKAITNIDQALSMVTALLRIREIEQTRRSEEFGSVALAELIREVGDLYEPFAEEKRVVLDVRIDDEMTVRGDRDLLFEAIGNLVDNAVKFTPEGGRIEVGLIRVGRNGDGAVRVSDTGPGVSVGERDLIVQRFYRADKSRHTKGLGLGLSLVAAIVKLHGFRLNIMPGPGFVAEIAFPRTTPEDRGGRS